MRKCLILFALILFAKTDTYGTLPKNDNIFKKLEKDAPSEKAILIFTVRVTNSQNSITGCDILFNRNSIVYSCQKIWATSQRDKETKQYSGEDTYYYTVDPGELDINLIEVNLVNGSYSSSLSFPLNGKFIAETGTINYLGEINIDLAKSTCFVLQDEKSASPAGDKFKTNFPVIFSTANGKMNTTKFSKSAPCETGLQVFGETFSAKDETWHFTNDPVHNTTISEDKMIINNQSTDSCVVSKNIRFPDSFDAEAECTWISGENNKGFGMIIGNDPITCLKFTITANGYFSVFRWLGKNGLKWFSPIVYGWTKTDLIDTSPNAKNVIRVQKTDWYGHNVGMIAFYINGNLVARNIFYISPPAGGSGTQFSKDGVFGLFSYGNQTVSFDNIKMSLLK